jgi:replicative DNA helicase
MNDMTTLQKPPHSLDAEQALIGAILIRSDLMLEIDLPAEAFYRHEHKVIWSALRDMSEARKPIDVLALSDVLTESRKLTDAGGIEYLAQISENAHSAANAGHYAEIVRGKSVQRSLCTLGMQLATIGYGEGDTQAKIDEAQGLLSGFSESLRVGDNSEPMHVDDCMRETIAKLQTQWSSAGSMLGLSTGFSDIDARTQGLRKGSYVVIAGRPSQGKTTIAMNIAENVAMAGGFVIVFCLDMPREDLMQRMIASVGRVDHKRLQSGQLQDDEFTRVSSAGAKVRGRALYIDDRTSHTSAQLLARARKIAHRLGRKPDLVVVDYLQLLTDKGEGTERVTNISRNLKNMARELDCVGLILSQLNRGVEGRNDKRPMMSDLRESGAIEQDADLIYMMYRDEYYDENSIHKGLAEAICRKYRNGQIGTDIISSAHLNQCRFENSTITHIERQAPAKRKSGFKYE